MNDSTLALDQQGDDYAKAVAEKLPPEKLRELSRIDGLKAAQAIVMEWSVIVAIALFCHRYWHPVLYLLAVMLLGARQHALAVLNHEATHYRLLPRRSWNDLIAEPLLAWPILISTRWFRSFHHPHHRHLGTPEDSNRLIYKTHTASNQLTRPWTFPKHPLAFAGLLFIDLLGITGIFYGLRVVSRIWTVRSPLYSTLQGLYYSSIVTLIFYFQLQQLVLLYWFIPLFTWFILTNHLRIIGEHSAIAIQKDLPSDQAFYELTRTTLPAWWDSLLLVPRNISYHIEHHMYPSVPFYRLPELHACLMEKTGFQSRAHITVTYWGVIKELVGHPNLIVIRLLKDH
jgi:fatty acid desaturase